MSKSKELWRQIKAELDAGNPNWRKEFSSFGAALTARREQLGLMKADEARLIAFNKALKDHQKALADDLNRAATVMETEAEEEGKEQHADTSAFDNTPGGRSVSAERSDQIGRELPSTEEDDESGGGGGSRGAAPGRREDSLYHPERSVAFSDKPFIWKPVAPREGSAIHC